MSFGKIFFMPTELEKNLCKFIAKNKNAKLDCEQHFIECIRRGHTRSELEREIRRAMINIMSDFIATYKINSNDIVELVPIAASFTSRWASSLIKKHQ